MRRFSSSFAVLTLAACTVLVACSAPPAERACSDYCDQLIFSCGAPIDEAGCMWVCLAGMEWRNQKGRRCHKQYRREVACLSNVTDCEFLLEEDSYSRGDPCAERGNARTAACNEDGIPADELIPLSTELDPDAEWPWSDTDAGEDDESDEPDEEIDDARLDGEGIPRGDRFRL